MANKFMDSIRFEDEGDSRSIELSALQSEARLFITRHPDGEFSISVTDEARQRDFIIPPNALGQLSLQWLGLSSTEDFADWAMEVRKTRFDD